MGVALVPAAAYLLISPNVYTSTARVQVTKPFATTLSQSQQTGIAAADSVTAEQFLPTQCQLLKTSPILASAVDSASQGHPETLRTFKGVSRPLTYLKRKLDADVDKKGELITVSFPSRYQDEANLIVDSVVAAYKRHVEQLQREKADQLLGVLRQERETAQAEMQKVNQQLLTLKQTYNVLSFGDDKDNFMRARLNSLSEALGAAHLETVNTRSSFEAAARSIGLDPQAVDQSANDHGVALSAQDEDLLKAELFTVRQQLAERRRTYLSDHPQIRALEAKMNQLNLAYVSSARARYQLSTDKEKQLQQSFDEQQRQALQLSAKADEAAQLEAQAKRLLEHCQLIDSRSRDLAVAVGAGMLNVVVQEPASWEGNDVSPSTAKVMSLFAILGLLAGCGVSLVQEFSDPKLRLSNESKEALGVPVLATLPRATGSGMPAAAVQIEPDGALAQAVNGLATLLRLTQSDVRALMITSSKEGDGKSTLAANLATALAYAGKRVCLIDANLRSGGAQHRFYNSSDGLRVTPTCGGELSAVLSGVVGAERAVVRTSVANLSLLPQGAIIADPQEMLNSPALGSAIDQLKSQYDYVIVDAPALANHDDARIIAASCDGTLIVMPQGAASRRAVQDAKDALLSVGANIAGMVINDASTAALHESGSKSGNGSAHGRDAASNESEDAVLARSRRDTAMLK
jgi:capsular exopolysaccharide synthesis family protein